MNRNDPNAYLVTREMLWAEVARLRAALQEHAECCTMSAHAREALAGVAVETDAWHCPKCGEPHTKGPCVYSSENGK